jgi:hypothetical protein
MPPLYRPRARLCGVWSRVLDEPMPMISMTVTDNLSTSPQSVACKARTVTSNGTRFEGSRFWRLFVTDLAVRLCISLPR